MSANVSMAVISLHDDNMAGVAAISYPNFDRYCHSHNYLFRAIDFTLNQHRHPAWSKIRAAEHLVSDGIADWICWMDCDALFMNHKVKLEQFVDPRFDILFCKDFNGLSTSFMLVKTSEWSLKFLHAVDICGDCLNQNPDGHGHKWEQNTIKLLLQNFPDLQQHCSLIGDPTTNRHYIQNDFVPGDFILHFPCMQNSKRQNAMRQMQKHIIYSETSEALSSRKSNWLGRR